MGTMVYSLLWVMQDLYHQPHWYNLQAVLQTLGVRSLGFRLQELGFRVRGLGFRV